MTRQSITLTKPNDEWLKMQIERNEYTTKSELVNDLIRRAREEEWIKTKLKIAEESGFTALSPAEILALSKNALRNHGEVQTQ